MAYATGKDVVVKLYGEIADKGSDTKIVFAIRCYNDGDNKIAIERKTNNDEEKPRRLGRLTGPEVIALGKLITKHSKTIVKDLK